MNNQRFALTLASVLLAGSALGNPLSAQAVAPPLWSRDSIRSTILGETRFIRISLPVGYDSRENATERYPVLIVLDGGGDVPLAAHIANARAMGGTNAPAIPRLIIVGVENLANTRFRDMTLPPADESVKRADGGGGAAEFLRFLSSELRPYLAERYRTHPFTVLAGHSLSGFFTEWAFGQAPDFLMGAIATSPSGFEQRRVLDGILARTAPGRLFLTSGSSEGGLDRAAQALAAALNAQPAPGRAVEHVQIPEVSHDHTGYLGIPAGLRFVFRPVSLAAYQLAFEDDDDPLVKFNAYFDSTRASFLRGARQLGLPERLPFSFLITQSRWYPHPRHAALLLRLCQEMKTSYSTVWQGYDCAGDAHARLGRATEALSNYRQAVDVARSSGDTSAVARITGKAEDLRRLPRSQPH